MNIHFVREKVTYGQVRILHVSLGYQIADIITNGLPQQFDDFRHILNIRQPPISIIEVY